MAEQEKAKHDLSPARNIKKERLEVITVRNWREYLGESMLIVFSVVLALALTEWFTKLHEKAQTRQILHQLRDEIISNKKAEEEQYQYQLQVLRNIDSALNNDDFAKQFMSNGRVRLYETIAPNGVILHDLNDVAWQIAKQGNAFADMDLSTISLLNDIYDNQQRITAKLEDEVGKVLLSWESRRPENLRTTLILIRDNYIGWGTVRAPSLIKKYAKAIEELKRYQ